MLKEIVNKIKNGKFHLMKSELLEFNDMLNRYQEEMEKQDIYSLTSTSDFKNKMTICSLENKKIFFDIYSSWDKVSSFDIDTGKHLENLLNAPNYYVGVHRTNAVDETNLVNDSVFNSILDKGLVVLGDASSGSIRKDPDPSKTVSICQSPLDLMANLKTSYKGSKIAIITMIPKEYITSDGTLIPGHENDIYDHFDGNSYLKKEFLYEVVLPSYSEAFSNVASIEMLRLMKEDENNKVM